MSRRLDLRRSSIGLAIVAVSAVIYWLANRDFDAGRGDFFYLADAFLHGRVVARCPARAERRDPRSAAASTSRSRRSRRSRSCRSSPSSGRSARTRSNRGSTRPRRAGVGLCWWLLGRIGVARLARPVLADRPVRLLDPDPVGHDPRRRLAHRPPDRDDPDLRLPDRAVGAAARVARRAAGRRRLPDPGAARLRGPVLRAAARARRRSSASRGGRRLRRAGGRPCPVAVVGLAGGSASLPSLVAFFLYNQVRFGTPFESPATRWRRCPPFLEEQRANGPVLAGPRPDEPRLLPAPPAAVRSPTFPFFQPDGLGMSVLLTSPGLLFAIAGRLATAAGVVAARRGRRRPDPDAALLRRRLAPVRLPLLPRLGAVRDRAVRAGRRPPAAGSAPVWLALIVVGVVVMAIGVYWAYNL